MSCSTCTITKPIPTCTKQLNICTLTPNTDYWVWLTNEVTGLVYRYNATTDNTGLLSIDMTKPLPSFYSKNFVITMHVTTTDIDTMNDWVTMTIDEADYLCFELNLIDINSSNVGYSNDYTDDYGKVSTDVYTLKPML